MKALSIKFLMLAAMLVAVPAHAGEVNFNLLEATPVGSWQLREDTTVDHKGRQSVATLRTSLLGSEERNGKTYYWIEMSMENFKVSKKGKRKPEGERTIIKTLVAESFMQLDPANVMTNLRGFGEEIIIQTGDQDPMRMSGSGGFLSGMMKAMGTEVNYSYAALGNESVNVPAGEFDALKISGSGSTETKVVFKKIRVESENTTWLSAKVPFGMVKAEGTSTTNRKESTHSSALLEFGSSGAVSLITKEPQDMPTMGNIFGK